MPPTAWTDRRTHNGGQSLVEFALVLPVFLLLLMAVFDFGRGIYAYNTVSNVARAALRVAIVDQNPTRVTDKALASATGLDLDQLTVDVSRLTVGCTSVKIGCPAEVTVDYSWTAITPIIGTIIGPLALSSTTTMPIERVYQTP